MTPLRLQADIEQSEAKLRDMRASLGPERTDVLSSCDKLLTKSRRGKLKEGEIDYLGKRVNAL